MYSPQYAIETDRQKIDEVISENPFATIVYLENGDSQSFHLPLLQNKNKLTGHMALANPAWREIENKNVLVIFHGPHCYISPTYYGLPKNVPTWNYISVQVRGKVLINRDVEFMKKTMLDLSQKYDPSFDISSNIEEHKNLFASIVGIEIEIENVFAKFKLAQSKPESERKNVIEVLEKSTHEQERLIADAMKKTLV